jgi:eukaryotic translation initiation factor 2C
MFAYDGEKSLYTVGPLPQIKSEFQVVLEESFGKRYTFFLNFDQFSFWSYFVVKFTWHFLLCGSETVIPDDCQSPSGTGKKSKRSFRSNTFKVELGYAAKIPLRSIALALKGADVDNNAQDALRVLDIILRQQAANRYICFFVVFLFDLLFFNTPSGSIYILLLEVTFLNYGC